MNKNSFYEQFFKRPFDLLISLIALLVLSPIIIVIGLLVRTKLGSPILFSQTRPGLHGKLFKIYKFRTMTDLKDENGNLLSDEIRLTSFGRFLRSTSLDELPGLINIVKGDMSLIGPRPLLVEYLPLYSKEQAKRHTVRPGLSGLAQVNGRNLLTWEEKFNLDVKYVQNVSFMGDIKLIFLTLKKVALKEGISATDHVTVEPFKGSE
ncbi:sugar transferase [Exiguobacterium aurantiacum]|uniref:Colanic biosynthesis UDP-glucose lipid carrier transferase n=1 Tax=Exiguobacterium aurantiacum TaxID=33987 RepID=A0A377FRP9_9BACL|nr:sugar transferase [Exiguobacterium aurantiacum]STO07244.1 Putative colanic biosynthesis UDP-glucose lipid carrier transferase [Exiguobacterium aurantiacum]